jgi:4-diphosphocytidyl-2-C-methyl-D-erythritol kinase
MCFRSLDLMRLRADRELAMLALLDHSITGARPPGRFEPGTHEASSISATVSRLSWRVVPAYAKLNLALEVVARRADGWHDIDSVLVPIDWHDLVGLSVEAADTANHQLKVDGPAAAGVPGGDSNLTLRAASALQELAGRPLAVRVWLSKSVPHGAGLGGGSADAAAVLRAGAAALAEMGTNVDRDHLAARALGVGSDVPALLSLSAHRVRGRGDRLEAVRVPQLHLAIASTTPSSTADTYAAVASDEIREDGRSARLAQLLDAGDAPDTSLLGSALEAAACRANPALADALERARHVVDGVTWFLTGSGGAVFSVTPDHATAEALATAMRQAGYTARACRTVG